MSDALLQVRRLSAVLAGSTDDVITDVSFEVKSGHILGLVGESGSGKTTVAYALLGHARHGVKISSGEIVVDGRDMLKLSEAQLRASRGRIVSYVPQDPAAALNPALRLSTQLEEVLVAHGIGSSTQERRARLSDVLAEVKLPSDEAFLRRYPHQLSGGQQQRVALAMAFVCRPRVIVMDEPTTGLDVTTQAHILRTVRTLCHSQGAATLFVSHDVAVLALLADELAVMYAGRILEYGPTSLCLGEPGHPYTKKLVGAVPDLKSSRPIVGIRGRAPSPGQRQPGCAFTPRCDYATDRCSSIGAGFVTLSSTHWVRCWRAPVATNSLVVSAAETVEEIAQPNRGTLLRLSKVFASYSGNGVLHDVDLTVDAGMCTALVGESGSGKTTLARCVAGLHTEARGQMEFRGEALPLGSYTRPASVRRAIQIVFQNPYSSLNPRRTVGESIFRPLGIFEGLTYQRSQDVVAEYLEKVGLNPGFIHKYPDQLSGGERQRVAIARALIVGPELLLCDEITSSLDVSVQASITELLRTLQRESGLTIVFVTHNLALIPTVADVVAVLEGGRVVECGESERVLLNPRASYTRRLLDDVPSSWSH